MVIIMQSESEKSKNTTPSNCQTEEAEIYKLKDQYMSTPPSRGPMLHLLDQIREKEKQTKNC